jgi:hypothetical protein
VDPPHPLLRLPLPPLLLRLLLLLRPVKGQRSYTLAAMGVLLGRGALEVLRGGREELLGWGNRRNRGNLVAQQVHQAGNRMLVVQGACHSLAGHVPGGLLCQMAEAEPIKQSKSFIDNLLFSRVLLTHPMAIQAC